MKSSRKGMKSSREQDPPDGGGTIGGTQGWRHVANPCLRDCRLALVAIPYSGVEAHKQWYAPRVQSTRVQSSPAVNPKALGVRRPWTQAPCGPATLVAGPQGACSSSPGLVEACAGRRLTPEPVDLLSAGPGVPVALPWEVPMAWAPRYPGAVLVILNCDLCFFSLNNVLDYCSMGCSRGSGSTRVQRARDDTKPVDMALCKLTVNLHNLPANHKPTVGGCVNS